MMNRKSFIFTVALLIMGTLSGVARNQWVIRDKAYDVDTIIFPHMVGPGMTAAKYQVPEIPLLVNVLVMDLTNPYAMLEPCLGGGYALGLETPVDMAARSNWPGHDVVGAINGDFFNNTSAKEMGIPASGQVTNSELLVSSHNRACFVLDENNHPYVDRLTFTGQVTSGETSFPLQYVNRLRNHNADHPDNATVLFTPAFNKTTYAGDVNGVMLVLRPAQDAFSWHSRGTEHCIIETIMQAKKSVPIPEGKAILYLKGSYASYANGLSEGDELDITYQQSLKLNAKTVDIKQLIGGSNHLFLRNGQYNAADAWDERHPRTAIGFSPDSTKVFFVVVDGRQQTSAGATLHDMADVFKGLGASDGVNLDGGGSSMLMVNDEIINTPSEGPVRNLGNGCVIVSNAPVDDEIGIICYEPRRYSLPASASTSFNVWGYNQYGVLKSRDLQGCTFSCDPQVGYFDANGVFNASSEPATGNLYVSYQGITATQPVVIVDSHWKFVCDSVLIDKYHKYGISVNGVSNFEVVNVDPTVVEWFSNDENVCTVDSRAVVSAVNDGLTYVGSSSPMLSDLLLVRVENPKAPVTSIENAPLDPDTWTVTQSGGRNRVVTALDNGLQLDFTGSNSRSPSIKLSKSVQIWGIPDTLRVRVEAEGIQLKAVKILVETAHGKRVTMERPLDNSAGGEVTANFPVNEICDPFDLGNYPLHLLYYYFTHEPITVGEPYCVKIPGLELIYSALQPVWGDLNGDREVTIADVNWLIDMLLSGEHLPSGDVNGDGEVTIEDVNEIIDMIL